MTARSSLGRRLFCVLGFIASIQVLMISCNGAQECKGFPADLEQPNPTIYDLSSTDVASPEIENAKDSVINCFSKMPYADSRYKLVFQTVKADRQGNLYLIFELYGIDDLRLAFSIDRHGKIVNAYQFSVV